MTREARLRTLKRPSGRRMKFRLLDAFNDHSDSIAPRIRIALRRARLDRADRYPLDCMTLAFDRNTEQCLEY